MEIRMFEHIVGAFYGNLRIDNNVVNQISKNTVETWQPDREDKERGSNTRQGKVAEVIVETFLNQYFNTELSIKTYDEIRNDNFEKHAPFDFLIWERGTVDIKCIESSIRNDIESATNRFVELSEYTRRLCKESNVKIAEVKSTKIRPALKSDSGFNGDYSDNREVKKLVDEIRRQDDVFCYPHYKRSELNENYSITDYCAFVKSQNESLAAYSGEELKRKVIELEVEHQCSDIFIRVYLDDEAKIGFVVGWMQKERLLDSSVLFKRMRQRKKSERALYFAKKLSKTEGIDSIKKLFTHRNIIYASPYTKTDFYHKDRGCKFIADIGDDAIIEFANEALAVAGGRYTRRCKECFD